MRHALRAQVSELLSQLPTEMHVEAVVAQALGLNEDAPAPAKARASLDLQAGKDGR